MEVILKSDVENLGYKDDTVTVKNGFGRNYLIPQGLAILATPSAKKVLAEDIRQRAHKEAKMIETANKTAEALARVELKLTAKAGKGGKLFGAITNANIAGDLAAMGHSIDKKFIQIAGGTIKAAGKYTAKMRLHREVVIDFSFEVIGEEN
ncbi:MAG: 50S ribosomal protein L9 [Cryomorphaceae bacterium BACL7 MAG-120910-bin2]|jgi:large subunit ribosomal protein L9|nr:MAG: 50S ribosomal protein L9 [Cryomorphaceae bacterium BACL7 MAG-120910-bin2]KRO69422.1 MAG: 50S ribosomal protein L9 [Cryomorphaceae bacterium BACL7 MAG-120322-bin74]KRO83004.1 MAG: 50S ribosomal protein L9 [Cryomorphaceae bacterium BACL7 MAG-121220-bin83]NQW25342.1 50S ribosomal protein L9 [Cryomorphaceae bacterium]|tara:strand:+ start:380 stop:832 length:453 start_codon:yes stop_codon:yes gene_type:complete